MEFNFYYGITIGELILRHPDMLNQTLQKKGMSAAVGLEVVQMTSSSLESVCDDASVVAFWQKVNALVDKRDIRELTLPRKHRPPSRLKDWLAPVELPSSAEDHFRQNYFEAIDYVIGGLKDWFEQPGYPTYGQLEQRLINVSQGKDFTHEIDFWCDFKDVERACLQLQLHTFQA